MVTTEELIKLGGALLKKPAANAGDGVYTLVPGVASDLATNVEKFMLATKELKPFVKENGSISAAEADKLQAYIQKLPRLKGEVEFKPNGDITFTPKALGLLEIDAPKSAAVAAPVAAPASVPVPAPATAPAASTPGAPSTVAAELEKTVNAELGTFDIKGKALQAVAKVKLDKICYVDAEKNADFDPGVCARVKTKQEADRAKGGNSPS